MTVSARSILCGAALMAAALVACSDTAGPPDALAECLDAAAVTGPVVAIHDFAFSPDTLRVQPGARVTWVNCEPPEIDAHTSTSDVGLWDSGFLFTGDTYARDFDQPGEFPYHCVPHPFMEAVIIVEESGA